MSDRIILGIETSCDDTCVGIIKGKKILSNIVISQNKIHEVYGGIVPNKAGNAHLATITGAFYMAMKEAKIKIDDINLISVAAGPGLATSLIVGNFFAYGLSISRKIPLLPVDHLVGHVLISRLMYDIDFPFLALIISGGHTLLILCNSENSFFILGTTLDDAVGEAFDKVGKGLGLPFPGGKEIEKLAHMGQKIKKFPKILQNNKSCDFSFSGIKTACFNLMQREKKEDIAYSLQYAVGEILNRNIKRAIDLTGCKRLVVGGGVASSVFLRNIFIQVGLEKSVEVFFPDPSLCTDNGVMIASCGINVYPNFQEEMHEVYSQCKIPRWIDEFNK